MKAYIITMTDDSASTDAATVAIRSSVEVGNRFTIDPFDATTPNRVDTEMELYDIKWNWPWRNIEVDLHSGLTKQPYLTADPKKRIACFLSHYRLWLTCQSMSEPVLIFEHDVLFKRKLNLDLLYETKYDIVGLNDPRKATRKSALYHEQVQRQDGQIVHCPKIDVDNIPQGLAGNSAYYIKPSGAQKLISLVKEYGAWPNDAIMCRQLMPGKLGQLKKYATTIQSLESTTTLWNRLLLQLHLNRNLLHVRNGVSHLCLSTMSRCLMR